MTMLLTSPVRWQVDDLTQELSSPVVRQLKTLLDLCAAAAESNDPVLLVGVKRRAAETIARLIHQASSRANGAFRSVACGLYARESLNCRIFGREKTERSYIRRRCGTEPGEIGLAHNGTLFINQIQRTDREIQRRLLLVLQHGAETERTPPRELCVRIIASTTGELEPFIASGRFCPWLANRLHVSKFQIPAALANVDGLKRAAECAEAAVAAGRLSSRELPLWECWRSLIHGVPNDWLEQ